MSCPVKPRNVVPTNTNVSTVIDIRFLFGVV